MSPEIYYAQGTEHWLLPAFALCIILSDEKNPCDSIVCQNVQTSWPSTGMGIVAILPT